MKATAETIKQAAAGAAFDATFSWECSFDGTQRDMDMAISEAFSTLPITLEQLAGIANGKLVLVPAKANNSVEDAGWGNIYEEVIRSTKL